jgi:tRNA/rRNA methyltransferase
MKSGIKRENIAIVLVETQIPENIGAVARAMNNMDIRRLILVRPKHFDLTSILRLATIHSAEIINNMEIYDDLMAALGSFQYAVGTTARLGSLRPALTSPRTLAAKLLSISENNSTAILFGPENRGLSNAQLRYCDMIANIPTSDFSSLNIAQAVMIICYEISNAGNESSESDLPRLANHFELEGMYDHLKAVLTKIGFLNPQNPERWMLNIRRFFSRFPLRANEVRTVRGICRQIDWYTNRKQDH